MIEAYVKVTRNFQVTIPLEIREKLNIKEGDRVKFVFDEESGKVYLMKVPETRIRLKAGRKLTINEIERIIEEGLKECMK
ncbi:MAG: AbrB family transcriptional regulator [Thermoprotei archaeon]|nr:MAG: AbrB family transcriptional regulator [Thermoprotei archaeon]